MDIETKLDRAGGLLPDLPQLDAIYWVTLVSACTMGETGADMISHDLGWGYVKASLLLGAIFALSMIFEFVGIGPKELRYWFAIVATATVGTTLADFTTRTMNLGYAGGSLLMIALFAVIFTIWRRSSIKNGEGKKLEIRYWLAVLVASVMGTTLGDFTSNGTPLGFGGGALVLGGLLLTVFLVQKKEWLPKEFCYWAAVVLTSTLGASTGDYMSKEEGMNLGTYWATGILAAVLVVVVITSALIRRKRAMA